MPEAPTRAPAGDPGRPPSRLSRWRQRDHTSAGLAGSLFVLAVPLLAGSLAMGVLYPLVDLAFLSRLGEAPMAAVIIANQSLRQLFFLLIMGGSFGAQALIARAVGEGRADEAEHVAGQVLLLGAVLAALLALVGGFFPDFLFSLPGPDPSFVPYGATYVRIVFVLSFGVVGSLLFSAILTGAGDTATPLFVTLLQTAVAIAAEWCLIFGHLGLPALGVSGAALGAAAGSLAAMALGLAVLFRGDSRVHLRRRHLRPDPVAMRRILALGWPPALQLVGSLFVTWAFIRLSGDFGEHVQAAYAIGLRLSMIVPAVCFPLATACATLVGQSLGAGDAPRAWRAVGAGLGVHGAVMWSFALVILLFRSEIVALFSDEAQVIRIGSEYLLYTSGSFFFWAFYFVFLRALQGAGDVLVPMVISLVNTFLVAVPLGYLLAHGVGLGPTGIWIAQLASSVLVTLATGLWLATGRWARRVPSRASVPRSR